MAELDHAFPNDLPETVTVEALAEVIASAFDDEIKLPKGKKARALFSEHAAGAVVDLINRETAFDRANAEPCDAEIHSDEYFLSHDAGYGWMRCGRLGPHGEHKHSDSGATWTDEEYPRG